MNGVQTSVTYHYFQNSVHATITSPKNNNNHPSPTPNLINYQSQANRMWGLKSSEMWHCVIGWVIKNVSKFVIPPHSGVKQSKKTAQPLKTNTLQTFELSKTDEPKTEHHKPNDLTLPPYQCDKFKSCKGISLVNEKIWMMPTNQQDTLMALKI